MKEKKLLFNETDRERVIRDLKRDFPGIMALDIDIEELVDKFHDDPNYMKKLMIKKELKQFQTKEIVPGKMTKIEPGSEQYENILKKMQTMKEPSPPEKNMITE